MKLQVTSYKLLVERRKLPAANLPVSTCNFQPSTFNPRGGFSLVEVLVVVSLLALIVLALMDVFSSTQRAFRASVTQSDVLEGSRAAVDLITSDLRKMTTSGGVVGGDVNFFVLDNNYTYLEASASSTAYSPLSQSLPGGTLNRQNLLNYFFVLGRENTKWIGIGYVVNVTNQSPLYPLYRFYAETNSSQPPRKLFDLFLNTVYAGQWTNNTMSHIIDGVVHLVARTYDPNGNWMTNGYQVPMRPPNGSFFYPQVFGEIGGVFYSNTLPASVELQLGVMEDRSLARAESLPNNVPGTPPNDRRTLYLSGQSGAVHIFRQQVTIPNVDRSAYQ